MSDESAPAVLDTAVLAQMAEDVEPELVPELIRAFLDEMQARQQRMAANCAAGELELVRAEAHSLKSSAAAFGANALAELALAIDRRGKDGDWQAVAELTRDLPDRVAAASTALTAYLAQYAS